MCYLSYGLPLTNKRYHVVEAENQIIPFKYGMVSFKLLQHEGCITGCVWILGPISASFKIRGSIRFCYDSITTRS